MVALSPEKISGNINTCNFFSSVWSRVFKYKIHILQYNLSIIVTAGKYFWEHPAGTLFHQWPPSCTLAAGIFPFWESFTCSEEELLVIHSCEMFLVWGRANHLVLAGTNAYANTSGLILLFPEKKIIHLWHRKLSFLLLKSCVYKRSFFSNEESTFTCVLVYIAKSFVVLKYGTN